MTEGDTGLRVLIVDDEAIIHDSIGAYLTETGATVDHARNEAEAMALLAAGEYDLALQDVWMPGTDGLELLEKYTALYPDLPVVIITGHGTMDTAVQALRKGATDFLNKPIKLRELDAVVQKVAHVARLQRDRNRLKEAIGFIQKSDYKERGDWRLIGESEETHALRRQIDLAVRGGFDTILITGETGTGKEVVTRAIHTALGREKPFIAVSCPAIPETLIESELFGSARGSFTGASENRPGSFEMADGGILFLDEISELSASAQSKLLRVLETRSVRRIGGAREVHVNVIVIAATNIPLHALVEEKRFRQDLFFRLNVFSIELKPLRERPADILPIAEHFLRMFASTRGLRIEGFAPEAEQKLLSYSFIGNARELRNIVERAAVITGNGLIHSDALPLPRLSSKPGPEPTGTVSIADTGENIPILPGENERIIAVLDELRWNRKEAARVLGMPYSTLRYKLKKLGID